MKKVIILHGYGGIPNSNWFPWLKTKLAGEGVNVVVPSMPNTNAPELSAWLSYLQQVAGIIDKDTYLVGHSLGCATILRFLESFSVDEKVGGIVLVAGFAEPIHFTELDDFTAPSWNDARIQAACNEIVLINSDDDPHVPLAMAERMQKRFRGKLVVMHAAEHISGDAGFTEVPIIYDQLAKIMGLQSSD